MLVVVPDLITSAEAADMRQQLARAEWQDGRATAGHRAEGVKRNLQLPVDDPLARQLGETILDRLGRSPLFIAATLPLRVLPPRFNRYEGGGTYGDHVDSAIFPLPGTQMHLRSDVSATLFLSDPDEYDGGELVIQDSFGERRVKLPAGQLVTYPGSSLHRVTPVTLGTRFAAFFWIQSFVAAEAQRRQLFELDGAIQALAADHPDHPSLDRLTGVYHNLLRQWSQT